MNIWRIYEYLVQVVHPFMTEKSECLYNGLVLKQAEQTDEYLLEVRDSALNIVKMIEQELADRQVDREADEAAFHESVDDGVKCCPDCERPNQFGEVCASCEQDRQNAIITLDDEHGPGRDPWMDGPIHDDNRVKRASRW